mmetsp:Transcript_69640/g.191124  ORF Transcript_69640/g.191124 Transcript_69640/m.191124 type:complete len:270 (+) Transcript_69640:472-1281(+)
MKVHRGAVLRVPRLRRHGAMCQLRGERALAHGGLRDEAAHLQLRLQLLVLELEELRAHQQLHQLQPLRRRDARQRRRDNLVEHLLVLLQLPPHVSHRRVGRRVGAAISRLRRRVVAAARRRARLLQRVRQLGELVQQSPPLGGRLHDRVADVLHVALFEVVDVVERALLRSERRLLLERARRAAAGHLRLALELGHLIAQLHDDALVLGDVRRDRLHVALHLRLQVLRAVGVFERVDRLLELAVRRRDVGNHDRAAVAAERVFQQPRHL